MSEAVTFFDNIASGGCARFWRMVLSHLVQYEIGTQVHLGVLELGKWI